jgi:large subunit ribosomal protein L7/L12
MFKVLLIVILVLVALVLLRAMFMRRDRGRELFVTEATGRTVLTKASGALDATPLEHEVIRLLERRQKIQAIKLVRQHTRLGLKEAKDVVEEVERTGRLRLPQQTPPPFVAQDVLGEARRLKHAGKAIEAIKLIRQHTGLGLKEAKDAYDAL